MKIFGVISMLAGWGMGVAFAEDLLYGHFEIHVDYDATAGNPDEGWRFSTSYNLSNDFNDPRQVVRMAPENAVFLAAPATETIITPALARFGPVGSSMWVLPQNNVLGTLFLGMRTTMAPGIFQARVGNNYTPSGQGSISLRLISVEGSGPDRGGHFAAWRAESLGNLVFAFDTTDGITAADEIPTIPVTAHTHYQWGLTRPGVYRVTFEAMGKLNSGNRFTSGQATFAFAVPHSGMVAEGSEVLIGADGVGVASPQDDVVYLPDRVLIQANQEGQEWRQRGWLSAAGTIVADGVGVMPEVFTTDAGEAKLVRVKEVSGPGSVTWRDADGEVLDMAAGVALGRDEKKAVEVSLSEKGIYRVFLEVEGSSGMRTATLVYGAGVGIGFDYDEWRSSFEKAAGLATGALADPQADADGDGLTNGMEFALFWQGFDPTRSDGGRIPLPKKEGEGLAAFDFLRDTWKDRLDEGGWRLRVETSGDLLNWTARSSRNAGYPNGIFESGAEEGNAWGRIMKRRLRVPLAGERAFFRFDLETKPN